MVDFKFMVIRITDGKLLSNKTLTFSKKKLNLMELDYMEILKLSMIQTFSCKVLCDVISSDIFSCKAHGGMFALNT